MSCDAGNLRLHSLPGMGEGGVGLFVGLGRGRPTPLGAYSLLVSSGD